MTAQRCRRALCRLTIWGSAELPFTLATNPSRETFYRIRLHHDDQALSLARDNSEHCHASGVTVPLALK